MSLKNWCSIHARCSKSSLKHSIRFSGIFPSLKHNSIAYRSSLRTDCIFEIHQLWQSGFSKVYSNCYCSCSFEREIIKIGQSSHKMVSNNIVHFQESTTILNACTKKSIHLLKARRICVCMCLGLCVPCWILIYCQLMIFFAWYFSHLFFCFAKELLIHLSNRTDYITTKPYLFQRKNICR